MAKCPHAVHSGCVHQGKRLHADFDNARQKQANQIKAIRSFISQQVDYIVLSPIEESGWDTVLQEAKDAGIPVILIDRKVSVDDDSLYASWLVPILSAKDRMPVTGLRIT